MKTISYFCGFTILLQIVMTVEQIEDEVIIRLPKFMDFETMQRTIDLLSLKEATARSEAIQEDVDLLSKEVNKGWWTKNRARYIK